MSRRSVAAVLGVTASLVVALGAPLAARAGFPMFDISLAKSHAGNFTVGGNGTFTLTLSLSNVSPGSSIVSDTLSVTDSLPNGFAFVTAGGPSFTCTNTGQVVHCAGAPTMSTSQTQTITVVGSVGSAASPAITNTASYTDSLSADTRTANNTATDVASVQAAGTTTTTTSAATPSPSPNAIFTGGPARPAPTVPLAIIAVSLVVLVAAGYGWHRLSKRS